MKSYNIYKNMRGLLTFVRYCKQECSFFHALLSRLILLLKWRWDDYVFQIQIEV